VGILAFLDFFNLSSENFYFFKSKSVNIFEFIGVAIIRNVHHMG